jgi:hypothetical protein
VVVVVIVVKVGDVVVAVSVSCGRVLVSVAIVMDVVVTVSVSCGRALVSVPVTDPVSTEDTYCVTGGRVLVIVFIVFVIKSSVKVKRYFGGCGVNGIVTVLVE